MAKYRSQRIFKCHVLIAVLSVAGTTSVGRGQDLPPNGTSSLEIHGVEEIVTFLLFDPATPGISLPAGLRFVPAHKIEMPAIREHVREHPEHAEWAFSIVEVIRDKSLLLDGKGPERPENGATGLWMAEVEPSQFAAEIGKEKWEAIAPSHGAVLVLGHWVPDREFVGNLRACGYHAEYGTVTLVKNSDGSLHGEIKLDQLTVKASATPHGEERSEEISGTQMWFKPGEKVETIVVVAGANPRHRECTAEWSKMGDHPLSHGVFVGPTYVTSYPEPLTGSVYHVRDEKVP